MRRKKVDEDGERFNYFRYTRVYGGWSETNIV